MINQETFSGYSKSIVSIVDDLQLTMIAKIARQLGKGKDLNDDDWKVLMLKSTGRLEQSLNELVKGSTDGQAKAINDIKAKAMAEGYKDAESQLKGLADVQSKAEFFKMNEKLLETVAEKLTQDTINANLTMLKSSMLEYTTAVNDALALKEVGGITRNEAVQRVLKEWSKSGVPALKDRIGRKWQPDAYLNMVVRTNSLDIAKETQQRRAVDYKQDLIITSQHADQSPEHAIYANKIFSLSGNDPKYPPFSQATSNGFMNRPNCRHSYYFYIPDVTTKNKDLPKSDKAYDISQEQRLLERTIRKQKKQILAIESGGFDASLEKANLRDYQANMRNFIKDTGRTRRSDRERI